MAPIRSSSRPAKSTPKAAIEGDGDPMKPATGLPTTRQTRPSTQAQTQARRAVVNSNAPPRAGQTTGAGSAPRKPLKKPPHRPKGKLKQSNKAEELQSQPNHSALPKEQASTGVTEEKPKKSRQNQKAAGARRNLQQYDKVLDWDDSDPTAAYVASEALTRDRLVELERQTLEETMAAPKSQSGHGIESTTQAATPDPSIDAESKISKTTRVSSIETTHLTARWIQYYESTPDSRWRDLKNNLLTGQLVTVTMDKATELSALMKSFQAIVDDSANPNESSVPDVLYKAVEEFSDNFNLWKHTHYIGLHTNEEFRQDREFCANVDSSERNLQQTLMMILIDRFRLEDNFTINCEGKWNQAPGYSLPSQDHDTLSSFLPDMAMFVKRKALYGEGKGWMTYKRAPPELQRCMTPEDDGKSQRCFPFLFFEAKRRTSSLEQALLQVSLYTSQALYNIYKWMRKAGMEEKFYEKIRVFSITLNAEIFYARIHRAEKNFDEDDKILDEPQYLHENLAQLPLYRRDDVVPLIRNIIVKYAEKDLLENLRSAFQVVMKHANKNAAVTKLAKTSSDSSKRGNESAPDDTHPRTRKKTSESAKAAPQNQGDSFNSLSGQFDNTTI